MSKRAAHTAPVGIDDIAYYIPKHYLPIEALAVERGIEPEKLSKGLGLKAMALPDVYEDTATMAANAVRTLMERHGLAPQDIGRLYLGTESALDGAKPTATYALEMLRRHYRDAHGVACFDRCDVIDLTFACIGGVDALLNTVDWVRAGTGRVGIVVASDFAKYELGSSGEYTQGAGAVALLVREHPELISIQPSVGVATRGVHDFFKPIEQVAKTELVQQVLALSDAKASAAEVLAKLPDSFAESTLLESNDEHVGIHRLTPTFDGPYSNWTYQNRIRSAYEHFTELVDQPVDEQPLFTWTRIIMHLPYAAHGRRILMDLFVRELQRQGIWSDVAAASKLPEAPKAADFTDPLAFEASWGNYLKLVSKTSGYRSFVAEQLVGSEVASSEVGNLYAGSIFMALASALSVACESSQQLAGKTLGFIAYGSGSKSKVFSGAVRGSWEKRVQRWSLTDTLAKRIAIDYTTYEQLHRGQLDGPMSPPQQTFALDRISSEENKVGARYYKWCP